MLTTSLERYNRAIKARDVEAFRDSVEVGGTVYAQYSKDDLNTSKQRAMVKSWIKTTVTLKAPFVAQTKHGTFRWADLYRWGKEHKEKYGY